MNLGKWLPVKRPPPPAGKRSGLKFSAEARCEESLWTKVYQYINKTPKDSKRFAYIHCKTFKLHCLCVSFPDGDHPMTSVELGSKLGDMGSTVHLTQKQLWHREESRLRLFLPREAFVSLCWELPPSSLSVCSEAPGCTTRASWTSCHTFKSFYFDLILKKKCRKKFQPPSPR